MRLPQAILNKLHNAKIISVISLCVVLSIYELAGLLYDLPQWLHIVGSAIMILFLICLVRELKAFLV